MSKKYYIGDFQQDSLTGPYRSWIVGSFIENGPRKTDALEVKYWRYAVGKPDHPQKVSATYECTFVLSGEIIGQVDGEKLHFRAGQYIAIPPGVANNLIVQVVKDAEGITVKAPSDPKAKMVVPEI